MRKVFISYAHEDASFVQRLAGTLQQASFAVQYDENIFPPEEWQSKLLQIVEWADCCIFVVSSSFNQSDFIRGKEREWIRLREEQLARIFKSFVVKLEHGCVSGEFARFQCADFIGWESDQNYNRGWIQLSHHLHHHQLYPDLFVGREVESKLCAMILEEPSSPGVLVHNAGGKRGLGNSMLLWHLEEGYLPDVLVEPYVIISLDWRHIIQKTGPIELLNYTIDLIRQWIDVSEFDAEFDKLIEQSRAANQRLRYTKTPLGYTIGSQLGGSGFRLEDQGRLTDY